MCLGYKADMIKNYFVNYNEYISNDFVFSNGGSDLKLLNTDIHDWKITFVDTGLHANIGQRLKMVEKYLDDDVFLANYSDGLTDMPLDMMIDHFHKHDKIACFMAYQPTQSFHVVNINDHDLVKSINHIGHSGLWVNTGYFILRKEIFKYMGEGEELVNEPFQSLIKEEQLLSYRYNGFWASMDTFKDKQLLDDMYSKGNTPWEAWRVNELR